MIDGEKELNFKITSDANLAAVDAATAKIEGLAKAQSDAVSESNAAGDAAAKSGKEQAHAAEDTSKSVKDLGHSFREGAEAGRVLGEVSRGNILALGSLGSALRAIGTLLKTNLIGTLVTLGAVAANVILPIIDGFQKAKEKIKETELSFKDATEEAKKLRDAKFDSLLAELKKVNSEADRALSTFKQLLEAQGRLDDAQTAAELASIEGDASLSKLDKVNRTAAVRQGQVSRRRAREDIGRLEEERTAQSKADQLEKTATGAEADRDVIRQRVDAIDQDRIDRAAQVKALQKEMQALQRRTGGTSEEAFARGERMQAIPKELEDLRRRQEIATSPEAKKAFEQQQSALKDSESFAKARREEANAQRDVTKELERLNRNLEQNLLPKIRAQEDTTRVLDTNQQRLAAAPTKQELDALKVKAAEAAARGDFAGQDAANAERKALTQGGGMNWEAVNATATAADGAQQGLREIADSFHQTAVTIKMMAKDISTSQQSTTDYVSSEQAARMASERNAARQFDLTSKQLKNAR